MATLSGCERLMEALRQAPPDNISRDFGAKQSLVFVVLGLILKHMQQSFQLTDCPSCQMFADLALSPWCRK